MIFHGLYNEILTVVVLLQKRLTIHLKQTITFNFQLVHLLDEIVLGKQGHPDVLHEDRQVLHLSRSRRCKISSRSKRSIGYKNMYISRSSYVTLAS